MTEWQNPHSYNDPIGGTDSTVGTQIRTDYFERRALVEAAKEAYFGQLAETFNMPKHMGKTIKRYHYLPILDDRNQNDQGIDAQGVSTGAGFIANTTVVAQTIRLDAPASEGGDDYYVTARATGADLATAKGLADAEAQGSAWAWAIGMGFSDGSERSCLRSRL
jgi:hypothetical protein